MAVTIILIVVICLLGYFVFQSIKEKNEKEKTINEQRQTIINLEKESKHTTAQISNIEEEKPREVVTIKDINSSEIKELHARVNSELQSLAESVGEKKTYKSKIENIILLLNSRDRKDIEKNGNEEEKSISESFITTAESIFPQLTKNDVVLIGHLLSGKSTKEIAALTNKEIRSVESARNRLRKKLELESGEDLKTYFELKIKENS